MPRSRGEGPWPPPVRSTAAAAVAALRRRLAIPVIYGVEAMREHANLAGAVVFPHHAGLRTTSPDRAVADGAHATSEGSPR